MEDVMQFSKWLICRTCLQEAEDMSMTKIFTDDGELVEKLELCGGVRIDREADLPDKICSKCLLRLKVAFNFRKLCQHAQEELLDFINMSLPKKNQQLLVDNVYEVEDSTIDAEDDGDMNQIEYLESGSEIEDVGWTIFNPKYEIESEEYEYQPKEDDIDEVPFETIDENVYQIVIDEDSNTATDDEGDELLITPSNNAVECKLKLEKATRRMSTKVVNKKMDTKAIGKKAKEKSFNCTYCGNVYDEKAKLTLHLKIHTRDKRHQCEICLKKFTQTPQLARHMNSHTGNRPFKCDYCNARFADPSTRIKHQRIHTNDRPYKCDFCNKSFSYSNVLKVHLMTHTGEKPFSCDFCCKKFSQLHHKKSHEKTHKPFPVAFSKTDRRKN